MINKLELKKFLIEHESHTIENTEERLLGKSCKTPNAVC